MNALKKAAALIISALMITASSGCNGTASETAEVTAGTKAEVKALVDEFYDGLTDANPVEMTGYMNGEITNIFTRDGSILKNEDRMNNITVYLFEEDGKKYSLYEGQSQPSEDEFSHELYSRTIEINLMLMITGYFTDAEEDGLKYSATRKDVTTNGKTESELSVMITVEEDGESTVISSVGRKTDDKVTQINVEMTDNEKTTGYQYDFKYDGISLTLPEYTIYDISQFYHHTESPFATFTEARNSLEDEDLSYMFFGSKVCAVVNKDGKYYQLSSDLDDETYAAFEALDFEADDYSEQVNALIDPLTIDDCIDFTDLIIPQETLDAYAGKTVGDLVEEGFNHNGYSIWDEGSDVYLEKDSIVYILNVTLPEGFDSEADFEFEDLYGAVINSMTYNEIGMDLLPME